MSRKKEGLSANFTRFVICVSFLLLHNIETEDMDLFYHLLWITLLLLCSPYVLFCVLWGRQAMRERLGKLPKGWRGLQGKHPIWAHAASMGEVQAVSAVLLHLKSKRPDLVFVLSTTSLTGLQQAKDLLKGIGDLFFMAPLDFAPFVTWTLRRIRPRALLIAETELWPSLIQETVKRGCRVAIINGRISERGYRRYQWISRLMRRTLEPISCVCVQSKTDEDRFASLGARPENIHVTGNVKAYPVFSRERIDRSSIRDGCAIAEDRPVLVAGSTREGEEDFLLHAFSVIKQRWPKIVFVLAPRHLKRKEEVEELIRKRGFSMARRSDIAVGRRPSRDVDVVLLDTMGELTRAYAIADIAFVGGSLVPIGGHNPFEPAAAGVPVLFGPYMQQDGAEQLVREGAAIRVKNTEELIACLTDLLNHPERRRQMGQKALKILRNRGEAVHRTVELLIQQGIV